jgi:hypothetical protein
MAMIHCQERPCGWAASTEDRPSQIRCRRSNCYLKRNLWAARWGGLISVLGLVLVLLGIASAILVTRAIWDFVVFIRPIGLTTLLIVFLFGLAHFFWGWFSSPASPAAWSTSGGVRILNPPSSWRFPWDLNPRVSPRGSRSGRSEGLQDADAEVGAQTSPPVRPDTQILSALAYVC